jgi:hypothetical protein
MHESARKDDAIERKYMSKHSVSPKKKRKRSNGQHMHALYQLEVGQAVGERHAA